MKLSFFGGGYLLGLYPCICGDVSPAILAVVFWSSNGPSFPSCQALAEAFLEHLWKIIQSPTQPSVLRQAAAGYMGSFLARANFLPVA